MIPTAYPEMEWREGCCCCRLSETHFTEKYLKYHVLKHIISVTPLILHVKVVLQNIMNY